MRYEVERMMYIDAAGDAADVWCMLHAVWRLLYAYAGVI